jgi:diguanylate cyclase (GGDEF)-like protein
MISLKRYLDLSLEKPAASGEGAYQAALETIASAAVRCCPSTGEVLQREIAQAVGSIKRDRSPRVFKAAHQQALQSLRSWGEQSEAYFTRKTIEVKEMLAELAGTAESIGKRDQRYTRQFQDITVELQTIAQLDDLSRVKASLLRSAGEMKGCVERMARESAESVAQLEASLASRRVELEQAQELAALDPLTGLYNRREVEARLSRRLDSQIPFCVVLIDLNDFKQINDRHGHLAGDEILRQVAHELRMASRADDTLGRWGGDEFVLVLDGSYGNTKIKIQRMRPWVFGNYEVDLAGKVLSINVRASIGISAWSPGDTIMRLLSRADAEMYRDKMAVR